MGTVGEQEQAALVALLRRHPTGSAWSATAAEVTEAGSAVQVWQRLTGDALTLFDLPDVDPLVSAVRDLKAWGRAGIDISTVLDARYPAQLREVHEMPPILFTRGQLVLDDRGVSVVGSRKASSAECAFAAEVASRLVGDGLAVLSGLATGIDAAAHVAALEAGGRTVAFLGTGINRSYPKENEDLHDRIAEEGLLVSQFWPDAPPQKYTFLMRNAVMSGYGRATVVVAAGETSGTRVQARLAVEHGRPVVLTARVANSTSWGAALRGRPGVYVASSPEEVLAVVRDVTRPLTQRVGDPLPDIA